MDDKAARKWDRRAKARVKARQLSLDNFVREVLKHPEGRAYLWWVMEISGIGRNPHTANALNTAFQCGEMNVGQKVLAHLMEVSPEGYLNMLREQEEERINVDRERTELDNSDRPAYSADDDPAD